MLKISKILPLESNTELTKLQFCSVGFESSLITAVFAYYTRKKLFNIIHLLRKYVFFSFM